MQMLNIGSPMGSVVLTLCRSNGCKKTILMLNIDPPMGSVLLPICGSIHVKSNTQCDMLNIDLPMGSSCHDGGDYIFRAVSFHCVQQAMQMLNVDPPMGLVLLPIGPSYARKKQCKCWYRSSHGVSFVNHCVTLVFGGASPGEFGPK